jgi:EmrB/QacA subfamily drug resistance transporter
MWATLDHPFGAGASRSGQLPSAPPGRGRWVLAATILASSMAFIDGTVVNVALPALQSNLNATALDVQWVVEAYSLLLSAFLLTGGSLGDHYGRRRIFLIGIVLFAAASAACGLAVNVQQLIAARAFQGFGAALLVPGSLSIIGSSFPEKERGRAIGTWSGASAITTGIGPLLGGWLIEHVSWRAVFFINVPIAIVVLWISLRHLAETRDEEARRVDWLGSILAALTLGALVYGLIESSRAGFSAWPVILSLSAATIFGIVFLIVEERMEQPMLPLALFRSRNFGGANLLTLVVYAALSGTLFFLPMNLIQVQHYSATAAGAALLPFIIVMALLSRWAGGLVSRYGSKLPLVIGPVIAALGYGLFALSRAGGSYLTEFLPATAVLGLGMAVSVAPLTTTVMSSVPAGHVGLASGINNAVARSAGLLAIAAFGIVMLNVFSEQLDSRMTAAALPVDVRQKMNLQRTRLGAATPGKVDDATGEFLLRAVQESFVRGFRTVMLLGGGLALAGGAIAALTIESRHLPRPP